MGDRFSLTPGFSPVPLAAGRKNRFNGFSGAGKPLKRLVVCAAGHNTRLKPGVNETGEMVVHLRRSKDQGPTRAR
jgi:hypothetical protein